MTEQNQPYTGRGTDEHANEEDEDVAETMADVSHTPPHGRGTNEVFERGREHTDPMPDEDV